MAKPKGSAKTGGRQKGTGNKDTQDLRLMILGALDKVGGQDWLSTQAKEKPAAFMQLIAKVLPMQVVGDPDKPIEGRWTVEIVKPKGD